MLLRKQWKIITKSRAWRLPAQMLNKSSLREKRYCVHDCFGEIVNAHFHC